MLKTVKDVPIVYISLGYGKLGKEYMNRIYSIKFNNGIDLSLKQEMIYNFKNFSDILKRASNWQGNDSLLYATMPLWFQPTFIMQLKNKKEHLINVVQGATVHGVLLTILQKVYPAGYYKEYLGTIFASGLYYSGNFAICVYNYYRQNQKFNHVIGYQAAIDTRSLLMMNTGIQAVVWGSSLMYQFMVKKKWNKASYLFGCINVCGTHAGFIYNIYQHGIINSLLKATIAPVILPVTVVATRKVINTIGPASVGGLLYAYHGLIKKKTPSNLIVPEVGESTQLAEELGDFISGLKSSHIHFNNTLGFTAFQEQKKLKQPDLKITSTLHFSSSASTKSSFLYDKEQNDFFMEGLLFVPVQKDDHCFYTVR